ncbi:MAG: hypothetical protein RKE50_07780 [Pseudohaliea sp.]
MAGALLLTTEAALAGGAAPLGTRLGTDLGQALSSVLPEALGSALPGGIGGIAGVAAIALILGAQLVKRRQ